MKFEDFGLHSLFLCGFTVKLRVHSLIYSGTRSDGMDVWAQERKPRLYPKILKFVKIQGEQICEKSLLYPTPNAGVPGTTINETCTTALTSFLYPAFIVF